MSTDQSVYTAEEERRASDALAAMGELSEDGRHALLGWLAGEQPLLVMETIERMRSFNARHQS